MKHILCREVSIMSELEHPLPQSQDFQQIGRNVEWMRRLRGWSQSELAARADISRTTLQRIERGMPTFPTTITKIASALRIPETEIYFTTRFHKILDDEALLVRHSRNEDYWYALGDQRRKKSKDDQELIQSKEERMRLGRQGFVRAFVSGMNFFLPEGPGINRMELFGKVSNLSMPQYLAQAVICISGRVIVTVGDDAQNLNPGEVIAVHTGCPIALEPDDSASSDLPCEAFFIGSTRQKVKLGSEDSNYEIEQHR